MSNFENAGARMPTSAPPPRTWDFWETALVTLIAYGVYTLASGLALTQILALQDGVAKMPPAQLRDFAAQGRWSGAALIIASPCTIAVLWIAIRAAGRGFSEYLALNWPSATETAIGFGVFAGLLVLESIISWYIGADYAPMNGFLIVRSSGGLLILLIAGCVAGPIMEEFIIRGFLFRGWSQSFPGPIGAIILTSIAWAMTHVQFDFSGKFLIFGMGLALGYSRWRSNSTWLTVMVHSTFNMFLLFTTGPYV
ncbi:CPBP family intramembrane glutamic endopeptidase [Bradyrhizobium acaciae]|uniref:CPBP family intramembrane glutamic endopeptidase n=1 Tax=Bradyrhizobium acaciae TaxID=2683706 RepID=UPI001E4A8B7D|nr:CPBP family intramembrane glutamic endopeptidase [Bradyrhizobium acaciae]MCC8979775.1 CPBP family intramembrane metalloprotease [Bradyrhizobium acaciae]